MTDKTAINAPAIAVLPLLLIWMAAILPFYHPNMGGGGLALPQNILAWSAMALTTLLVTASVCLGRARLSLTPTARLLLLGIAVLALPLLYTRAEWREDALWRSAGLLGGWLFYVACLQLRLTTRQRDLLLYGLLFAVSVQALLAALQLFAPALAWVAPNGHRVYGVFQQPNVLGSFIATGLALALWLLLAPLSTPTRRRQLPLLALLAAFSALLVLIQSRAAWLGGALAAALLLWRFARQRPAASRWAGGALLLGVAAGLTVLFTGLGLDSRAGLIGRELSNSARLTMLHDVGAMILAKPLLGWGYGGFEYSFAHFRLQEMPWREVLEVAGHPHNEILLWWVEGGLPALAGIVIVLVAGALLLKRAWQRDREQPGGARVGLFLVLLPMLVHTQLEYPFYLSAPHWLAFLLLALLDGQTGEPRPLPFAKALSLPVAMAAIGMLVMAIFAWQGRMALTQSERTMLASIDSIEQMPPPAAWIYRERKTFDEQSHALLVYNQTRDDALLTGYRQWANAYLQRRIDANVYATLIMILRYQGAQAEADARQREAAFLFARDARFR